jgi:hypothetical protein
MPDEFFDLELELGRLRPRDLSSRTHEAIAAALTHSEESDRAFSSQRGKVIAFQRWLGWSCAALFVFGMLLFSLGNPPPATAATPGQLIPTGAANQILNTSDEGLVQLDDGTTARRYRIRSIDTITWKDPASKASLQWNLPREDVRIVPVQAY